MPVTREQYIDRFAAEMAKQGIGENSTLCRDAAETWADETCDGDFETPELDAQEELSNWTD